MAHNVVAALAAAAAFLGTCVDALGLGRRAGGVAAGVQRASELAGLVCKWGSSVSRGAAFDLFVFFRDGCPAVRYTQGDTVQTCDC